MAIAPAIAVTIGIYLFGEISMYILILSQVYNKEKENK